MNRKIKQGFFIILFSIISLLNPIFIFAQSPTNPGTGGTSAASSGGGASTGITYECKTGDVYGNCTFDDLIRAVKKFFAVAIPLALAFIVVVIAYAGYLYMTSGGSPGQRAQANKMFISVAWGIFFMLGAWVIVTLVTNSLLKDDVKVLVPLK